MEQLNRMKGEKKKKENNIHTTTSVTSAATNKNINTKQPSLSVDFCVCAYAKEIISIFDGRNQKS